jgi:hypothetical protein
MVTSTLFLPHASFCALLIQSLVVTKNKITVVADPAFAKHYLTTNFFAEYDNGFDLRTLPATVVAIPFIMNVIPIVWISDAEYTIDAMDEDLYYALQNIQKVFQSFYPSRKWSGRLVPTVLIKNSIIPRSPTALTVLFSHGLDAVYTSMRNRDKKQMLVTVCGGDIGLNKAHMWHNVQELCRQFARTHGHENAFVRSNFNTFRNFKYLRTLTPDVHGNWFAYTSQGLGYTGLAAPIAYLSGSKKVLIASTRTGDNPFPYGTHPAIDNAIAFAGIVVDHDGSHADRLKKIREISALCTRHELKKPMLRVCWGKDPQGGNCRSCEKCFRTIVELLIEGEVPQEYGFNIGIDEALKSARAKAPGAPTLSMGLMWHWQCIQNSARAALSSKQFPTHRWQEFVEWIAGLDLEQFRKRQSKKYTHEEKKWYMDIWHRAVAPRSPRGLAGHGTTNGL